MNFAPLLAALTTQLAKAQALAALHRAALVLAGEGLAAAFLLWGIAYRPRTCIAFAVAAYLLYRYGAGLLPRGGQP